MNNNNFSDIDKNSIKTSNVNMNTNININMHTFPISIRAAIATFALKFKSGLS